MERERGWDVGLGIGQMVTPSVPSPRIRLSDLGCMGLTMADEIEECRMGVPG